jgi:hypothetical protein
MKPTAKSVSVPGTVPSQNDLKQADALSPLLLNFSLEYAINKVQKIK